MFRVIVKSKNLVATFSTYKEAEKYFKETRKNWSDQIDEMEDGQERNNLIDMYFEIRIERVPATIHHEDKNISCFVYPNAYIFADTTKYEDGDYVEVARFYFEGYERGITYRENSILEEVTIKSIEKAYKQVVDDIINHRGVEISACHQRVYPTVKTAVKGA